MKKFLFIVIFLAALIAAAGWYLLKPKSLGITYAPADLSAAKQKLNVTYTPLPAAAPAGKTLIVSGAHPVDKTFTSEELTALADNRRQDYAYFPFRNVQIRVNGDGTVEGSATINYQDAVNFFLALGVSQTDINEGAAKFKVPNTNLPVYLKVSGNVTNNQSQIKVEAAKIANISVPQNLVDQYGPAINGLVEMIIRDRQPSYRFDKLEVTSGQVHFQGTSPDQEMATKPN